MNIQKLPFIALVFLGTVLSLNSGYAQEDSSPILLSFDREQVSLEEFQRVYNKNNGGADAAATHAESQYREYLDLYINFKRKVFEAEDKGIHESTAFLNEFETYKKQLVEPYMSAKEVEDQLIQEAYDRSQFLINASHILFSLDANALPNDTLATYQKALRIRDSILNGQAEFNAMAQKHSQDPSAKTNGGNLGFFGVFDMVYPFETAAFTTPEGEISLPVRTVFGYHVVKVQEKISNSGKKKVSHIIVRIGDRYSAKDSTQATEKIQELYKQLKEGEDFAQLARQFSDDPGTAPKGGDLGTIRLLPEMEEVKLSLSKGEISRPFTTAYGWHIMTVTDVEAPGDFESSLPMLKQKIARDSRSRLGQEALIERIKSESGYQEFGENFASFSSQLDQRFAMGSWTPDSTQAALYALPLFKVSGKEAIPIQALVDHYLKNKRRYSRLPQNQASKVVKDAFVKEWLLAYEEEQLPVKNPEFRHLLKEYRDGIMLFTLMEEKVWKKAVEDTTGLKAYYETHQDSFYADLSMDIREYRCSSDSLMIVVGEMLKSGKSDSEIDSLLNKSSALNVRFLTLNYEKGKSDIDERLFEEAPGYVSEVEAEEGYFVIRVIEDKFPAGIRPFEKAKSEAITQYQDYLEKQWLAELAEKYPVSIQEEVFTQLFQ